MGDISRVPLEHEANPTDTTSCYSCKAFNNVFRVRLISLKFNVYDVVAYIYVMY